MSSLHETIATGNAQQLGPVTVVKCWPLKTAKNGNSFRGYVVTDHTTPGQEVSLTVFGATATTEYPPGTAIVFRPVGNGSIKLGKPYNGKQQLTCDQCIIEPVGTQGMPAQPHPAQQVAQQIAAPAMPHSADPFAPPPQAFPVAAPLAAPVPRTRLTAEAWASRAAKCVGLYVVALVNEGGFSREEAVKIASGLNNAPPFWHFGDKDVLFASDN